MPKGAMVPCEWCEIPFAMRLNGGRKQMYCSRRCRDEAYQTYEAPVPLATGWEAAYAAGIIDGEGSISFQSGRITAAGVNYLRPVIHVSNTDFGLMVWFRDHFGGNIMPNAKDNGVGRKPLHRWYVGGFKGTIRFLDLIYPYLVIKRAQADLVREFAKTKRSGGGSKPIPEADQARRQVLVTKMRDLNRRGLRVVA